MHDNEPAVDVAAIRARANHNHEPATHDPAPKQAVNNQLCGCRTFFDEGVWDSRNKSFCANHGNALRYDASRSDIFRLLAALKAVSAERDEARAALARIEALRDSVPTDRDIDASLIPLGFHPDEAYPEWSHNHLRIAYREGWEDAADAALRGDEG